MKSISHRKREFAVMCPTSDGRIRRWPIKRTATLLLLGVIALAFLAVPLVSFAQSGNGDGGLTIRIVLNPSQPNAIPTGAKPNPSVPSTPPGPGEAVPPQPFVTLEALFHLGPPATLITTDTNGNPITVSSLKPGNIIKVAFKGNLLNAWYLGKGMASVLLPRNQSATLPVHDRIPSPSQNR
jgi:hypothetical protein